MEVFIEGIYMAPNQDFRSGVHHRDIGPETQAVLVVSLPSDLGIIT